MRPRRRARWDQIDFSSASWIPSRRSCSPPSAVIFHHGRLRFLIPGFLRQTMTGRGRTTFARMVERAGAVAKLGFKAHRTCSATPAVRPRNGVQPMQNERDRDWCSFVAGMSTRFRVLLKSQDGRASSATSAFRPASVGLPAELRTAVARQEIGETPNPGARGENARRVMVALVTSELTKPSRAGQMDRVTRPSPSPVRAEPRLVRS